MTVRCISGSVLWNGQVSKSMNTYFRLIKDTIPTGLAAAASGMTEYQIVYRAGGWPAVTGANLQKWAHDALANGDTDIKAATDQEAIDVLEDCGYIRPGDISPRPLVKDMTDD